MVQRWHDLLFAHWRCPITDLRPLIPPPLEIDTYDGSAWIGVIPFTMSGVRMRAMLPVPTANAFPEINVRTYVTLDGRPGVWFFSLDCASPFAVFGARVGIHLPYFRATMRITRTERGTLPEWRWPIAGDRPSSPARYRPAGEAHHAAARFARTLPDRALSLYSASGKRIWRGDIVHPRWALPARPPTHRSQLDDRGRGHSHTR